MRVGNGLTRIIAGASRRAALASALTAPLILAMCVAVEAGLPAPGPRVGTGLPALLLAGTAIWAANRAFRRRK